MPTIRGLCDWLLGCLITQKPHSSSFLGVPYRILNMNPKKGTTMGPLGRASKLEGFALAPVTSGAPRSVGRNNSASRLCYSGEAERDYE